MAQISDKNLFLFTVDFPFGNYETSFLTQEIHILANYFDKIFVIPYRATNKTPLLKLPENVEVLVFDFSSALQAIGIKHYYMASILIAREFFASGNFKLIKNIRYHLSEIIKFLVMANKLKDSLASKLDPKKDICYSYWLDEWASILSILKEKYMNKIKIVSRTHGFDLYDYRNSKGYIFPRRLQLKNVNRILAVSADGAAYLTKKYPALKKKIGYSRLGVSRNVEIANCKKKEDYITLVSCSSVIKLKRIHLIAEMLMFSNKNIKWIHFGDGPLLQEVEEICRNLPVNVTVELRGNLDNTEIKKYYGENFVDWFINVSEYEGIPVSMMEAVCFGIPVIATNVGGVKEIVNEITGILIPLNFDAVEVVRTIEDSYFDNSKRSAIIKFWEEYYNAKRNFTDFSNQLISVA